MSTHDNPHENEPIFQPEPLRYKQKEASQEMLHELFSFCEFAVPEPATTTDGGEVISNVSITREGRTFDLVYAKLPVLYVEELNEESAEQDSPRYTERLVLNLSTTAKKIMGKKYAYAISNEIFTLDYTSGGEERPFTTHYAYSGVEVEDLYREEDDVEGVENEDAIEGNLDYETLRDNKEEGIMIKKKIEYSTVISPDRAETMRVYIDMIIQEVKEISNGK